MKTFARHSAFWALLSLLLSPLAVAHALAPPADSVPSITEQGQRDHIRPAAKRLSEEEAYSSEDSPEDFLIREPSQALRETFGLTPFYQQWIDVEGYPILGSENVSPYAMKEAAWLIRQMTSHRPDVLQAMVENKDRFSVIAHNEMFTQIPEYSDFHPNFYWDIRARGQQGPVVSCAEDNLLNYPGDPWGGYSVLIHEFAHSVHHNGLNTVDSGFDGRLQAAFEAAIEKGLWIGMYASSNRHEYFAEGATAWFNAHREHFDINTRTKLKEYDPELAKLVAEVFGDTDWRYTPPATRTHLPHLQGFNPQDSPTFEFPPELAACKKQLYEPDGDCGEWVNLALHDPSSFSPLRSPKISEGTLMTNVILVNTSGSGITYYWIDENGTEIYRGRHAFGLRLIRTEVGQIWLLKDQHGNDLGVFRAEEKTGRVFIGGETEALADGEEEDINSPAVNVPDANLAAAVRDELGLAPQASITQQAIQRLMALIVGSGQITDLTGLEHATGLVRLSLWDNQIEDVSPLAGLTQLQQLHIQANRIADITPLAGLTELRQLHLWGNQIRDIGVLAGLTKLESLWLAGNPIQDTSPLRTLLELNPNLDIDIEMALISESEETEPLADSEPSSEDQQGSEEQPTTAVELEGISVSHDSIRENDEQATVITLTVTLDKAAATDETITLAIISPTQGKTAKRGEDFDATLPETLTIAKGQRTGTAQLTLTPKDNTTADGDKAFAVQATSSSGHSALINIKIIDNDSAVEPQAWLTPDPSEVEFSADDPAWKTFTVHTNLDSVLVRANPSGSDPAIEIAGGQQVPSRAYCPAEGNDRPTRGRRDGWSLHVKACQAGRTKILLIDYDTDAVVQQYEVNVEAYQSASATTTLNPSYPNPFNSETVLSYTLPTASDIRLEVFTLNGQRVAVLHEGFQVAGYHTIAIDASALASGVYLYRLTTPEGRFVQKFTLLR